jgi:hypothetical protein
VAREVRSPVPRGALLEDRTLAAFRRQGAPALTVPVTAVTCSRPLETVVRPEMPVGAAGGQGELTLPRVLEPVAKAVRRVVETFATERASTWAPTCKTVERAGTRA